MSVAESALVELPNAQVIQASAGTGKTYALSGQFILLLLAGEDPAAILASTFTRKAAGEILERIYLRLARALRNEEARRELVPPNSRIRVSTEEVATALQRLIENQFRLKIETLDALSSKVARLFSEEIGLPQGWRIQEEYERHQQLSSAVAAVCSSLRSDDVASLVTTLKFGESKRSIGSAIGTIVGRLLEIFQESGPEAWDWIQVTDSEKLSAGALLQALSQTELPKTKAGETSSSYIKAVDKIIRLVEQEGWDEVIKQTLIQNANGEGKYSQIKIPPVLSGCLQELNHFSATKCLVRLHEANRAAYALLYAVFQELQTLEEQSGTISFDRVNRRVNKLGSALTSDDLYFRLDTQIHHVLLDEFQDTSLVQWRLLEPLVSEKVATTDIRASFFCVGDGKQAIYGWRGGSTRIFDSIPKRWPQISVLSKETSFRSEPEVIAGVNAVFQSLPENEDLCDYQEAVSSWLSRFRPHSTFRPSSGNGELRYIAINCESDSDEYWDTFFAHFLKIGAEFPQSSIGILVPDNEQISFLLDRAVSFGLELGAQGGTPLTRFSVVTSLLALLSLVENPGDSIKQFEVSASPWCRETSPLELATQINEKIYRLGLTRTLQELFGTHRDVFSSVEHHALQQLLSISIKFETSTDRNNLSGFIRLVERSIVPDANSSNIQVMTIHKSKGLEFDVVVLPELSWRIEPKNDFNYLIERDSASLKPLRVSLPGTAELRDWHPQLAAMASKMKQELFEESLSRLYVAMTRARTSLWMFTPSDALEKKAVNAAKLIARAIKPLVVEQESVDACKAQQWKVRKVRPKTPLVKKISLVTSTHRTRGLARSSPSSYVQSTIGETSNKAAERFGSAIHKLFSMVTWLEELPSDEKQTLALIEQGSTIEEARDAIKAFKRYLVLTEIQSALQRPASDAQVYTEKSFVFRKGNALVHGKIDRLYYTGTQGSLFDFKVGCTPPRERLEAYKLQLSDYAEAARRLFPGVTFKSRLIFLGDGKSIVL